MIFQKIPVNGLLGHFDIYCSSIYEIEAETIFVLANDDIVWKEEKGLEVVNDEIDFDRGAWF